MRIRDVLKEFEAHIHPARTGDKITGKSEWKQYGDGVYRFKVSIRNIALPDNSRIELLLDDTPFMSLTVLQNKSKVDIENQAQIGIPTIQAGQTLRVMFGETILAEGVYASE